MTYAEIALCSVNSRPTVANARLNQPVCVTNGLRRLFYIGASVQLFCLLGISKEEVFEEFSLSEKIHNSFETLRCHVHLIIWISTTRKI